MEVRLPAIIRQNTHLPRLSVPNRYSLHGFKNALFILTAYGSCRMRYGPISGMINSNARNAALALYFLSSFFIAPSFPF